MRKLNCAGVVVVLTWNHITWKPLGTEINRQSGTPVAGLDNGDAESANGYGATNGAANGATHTSRTRGQIFSRQPFGRRRN
jgi:hypothetical protein